MLCQSPISHCPKVLSPTANTVAFIVHRHCVTAPGGDGNHVSPRGGEGWCGRPIASHEDTAASGDSDSVKVASRDGPYGAPTSDLALTTLVVADRHDGPIGSEADAMSVSRCDGITPSRTPRHTRALVRGQPLELFRRLALPMCGATLQRYQPDSHGDRQSPRPSSAARGLHAPARAGYARLAWLAPRDGGTPKRLHHQRPLQSDSRIAAGPSRRGGPTPPSSVA